MADECVSDVVARTAALLAAAGIDRPVAEARMLIAHATGLAAAALIAAPGRRIDAGPVRALAARRAAREPMAYILGTTGFWTLTLAVSPATLIPRADSETLIEAAVASGRVPRRILDLGTGTGALLLAALAEFPGAWGLGTDRIPAACRLAAANAAANGLADRACFACADWAAPIAGTFDLILCNPPYIPAGDVAGLMAEVARHEPASALAGGADGLAAYRRVFAALPGLLAAGGQAIVELGVGQGPAVVGLGAAQGLASSARADLAGHDRALSLWRA